MWSNKPIYMAGMTAGRPVMQALARGEDALDENSAWIPVVKGWTSTRDFDVLAPYRFRTWFKEHKKAQAKGQGAPEAQAEEGGEQ